MNNVIRDYVTDVFSSGTEEYHAIWTAVEIMEKHGCPCTFMSKEEHLSCQELVVRLKRLALTFALPTEERNTLFSIYQEVEKLTRDYTKYSKKSKMDWYLTTDTQVVVEIFVVQK